MACIKKHNQTKIEYVFCVLCYWQPVCLWPGQFFAKVKFAKVIKPYNNLLVAKAINNPSLNTERFDEYTVIMPRQIKIVYLAHCARGRLMQY